MNDSNELKTQGCRRISQTSLHLGLKAMASGAVCSDRAEAVDVEGFSASTIDCYSIVLVNCCSSGAYLSSNWSNLVSLRTKKNESYPFMKKLKFYIRSKSV